MSRYGRPSQKKKKEEIAKFKDWVPGATDRDATRCLEASVKYIWIYFDCNYIDNI